MKKNIFKDSKITSASLNCRIGKCFPLPSQDKYGKNTTARVRKVYSAGSLRSLAPILFGKKESLALPATEN